MFDNKHEEHTPDISVKELYAQWSDSKRAKAEKATCFSENTSMHEKDTCVPTEKGKNNIDPQDIIALCIVHCLA